MTTARTVAPNQMASQKLRAVEPREDRARLQSHQQEGEHVEHEHDDFPDRVRVHAVARRLPLGPVVRRGHRERDDRENRRHVQVLGDDPRAERDDELGDARRERLAEPPLQQEIEPGECETEHDAAGRGDEQARNHVDDRRLLPRGDRDGGREDEQRGRVVEQALTLQDGHRPAGKRELRQHRRRRGRIGRRDDRAERDGRRERHTWPRPAIHATAAVVSTTAMTASQVSGSQSRRSSRGGRS